MRTHCQTTNVGASLASVCVLALSAFGAWMPIAHAYESEIHQRLTFLAARQFNQCAQNIPGIERLSALDTRYVVRSNVAQADGNFFLRMFRWTYYNRDEQQHRTSLGVIDTRFHQHFESLLRKVDSPKSRRQQLRDAGRILNYIQDVTSPAHVVPVYTGRWWRLSLSDRFNNFPIEDERIERAIAANCDVLLPARTNAAEAHETSALPLTASLAVVGLSDEVQDVLPNSEYGEDAESSGVSADEVVAEPDAQSGFQEVLVDVASQTISAVRSPIYGFPATWEAYWEFADEADEFGEYGPAGNLFGQRTRFRCGEGEQCLLLKDDPLYRDFAFERHVAAVEATMRAFALLQATPVANVVSTE